MWFFYLYIWRAKRLKYGYMSSGRDGIAEDGKATQFPYNDPTKGGRKPSIKKQLFELLESGGQLLIKAKDVVSTNDVGDVIIKVPTQMQIAMKLKQWAMSKKGNDSIKAIQMIMEQVDGKPKQSLDVTQIREQPLFPEHIKE